MRGPALGAAAGPPGRGGFSSPVVPAATDAGSGGEGVAAPARARGTGHPPPMPSDCRRRDGEATERGLSVAFLNTFRVRACPQRVYFDTLLSVGLCRGPFVFVSREIAEGRGRAGRTPSCDARGTSCFLVSASERALSYRRGRPSLVLTLLGSRARGGVRAAVGSSNPQARPRTRCWFISVVCSPPVGRAPGPGRERLFSLFYL